MLRLDATAEASSRTDSLAILVIGHKQAGLSKARLGIDAIQACKPHRHSFWFMSDLLVKNVNHMSLLQVDACHIFTEMNVFLATANIGCN